MVRPLRALGAALLLVGAVLLGFQTGGFDQVVADRGVTASVAPDASAYLAVQDEYDGTTVEQFCFFGTCFFPIPVQVSTVENRYVTDYTAVDVRVVAIDGGPDDVLAVSSLLPPPSDLAVGESGGVWLACTGEVTANGTADVTLAFGADGDGIHVDGARVTVSNVAFDCLQT